MFVMIKGSMLSKEMETEATLFSSASLKLRGSLEEEMHLGPGPKNGTISHSYRILYKLDFREF